MQTNFLEWVKKTESDWSAVKILAASQNPPNDVIVFHCQQTSEKYLKAFLSKNLGSLEKTHNLLKLASEIEQAKSSINILLNDLILLNDFSIIPR
ncbi:MAG: HEPN domain-containing protein [Chitinophagales bacterium]|nr:HEPN domain-containing protein [Chitinophagales bacterium]